MSSVPSPLGYDLSRIQAAVLAGGLGIRLRPVVDDRPKPLAEVAGRPFLAFVLDQLLAAGLSESVLCVGYRGSMVSDVFGSDYRGLKLRYSYEKTLLGTGGALRLAAEKLQSEIILAVNGDSYCACDLAQFCDFAAEHGAPAAVLLTHVSDSSRFGQVQCDPMQRIVRFDEKGSHAGPGWINAGVYLLSRDLLLTIPADRSVSLEKEVFPAWAAQGELWGSQQEAPLLDIGTPESFAQAEEFFSRFPRPPIF